MRYEPSSPSAKTDAIPEPAHQHHGHHRGIWIAAIVLAVIVLAALAYQVFFNGRTFGRDGALRAQFESEQSEATMSDTRAAFEGVEDRPLTPEEAAEIDAMFKASASEQATFDPKAADEERKRLDQEAYDNWKAQRAGQ